MSVPGPVVGIILAGGLGTRMGGGDKPLVEVGGKPMLAYVIERFRPQVDRLVLNANGDPARFSAYGLPVIADSIEGYVGPLAGLLAGMRWTEANYPAAHFVVTAAADTPFFPADLVARLSQGCGKHEDMVAVAASGEGAQPVFSRWPVRLADELEAFLERGERKILGFADRFIRLNVPFDNIHLPSGEAVDPFFNVNTPEEAARAESIAAAIADVPA